jgi:hypothetical protein
MTANHMIRRVRCPFIGTTESNPSAGKSKIRTKNRLEYFRQKEVTQN